jgi:hypothetical protein
LHISDPNFNKLCHVDEHVILMILGSGLHEKSLGLNMLGNCKALGMVENPTKQKTLLFFVWGGGRNGDASYGDAGKHTQRH